MEAGPGKEIFRKRVFKAQSSNLNEGLPKSAISNSEFLVNPLSEMGPKSRN